MLRLRTLGGVAHGEALGQVAAWAVIQAGTTGKLHSSFNIASLTDNGAGDFTVSLQRSMNATAYAIFIMAAAGGTGQVTPGWVDVGNPPTASTVRLITTNNAGTNTDFDPTTVALVGEY